jgi:hypothetical protein
MSNVCPRRAKVMRRLDELQAQLSESKQLLFSMLECPAFCSAELHDLGSSAVLAEQLVAELSKSISLREAGAGMVLDKYEVCAVKTALLVEHTIGFAIARAAEHPAGSLAVH